MSGPYDSHYAHNTGYGQAQDYYNYNQYQTASAYPTQGYAHQHPQSYQQQPQSYSNPQGSYYQPQTQSQHGHQPADGERGLLGAISGGAAGGVAGHKMAGHGILGTIGGAILGSLAEDYAKGKHNKHKKHSHHHHNHQHHQQRRDGDSKHSNSGMSGGLGPLASSLFSTIQKR